jgi:protein-disulfide isomerase
VANGTIRWRYIDFPLDMHRNTWQASIAAACADEQGKFWPMHDAIFAAQDRWNSEATSNPNKILKQIGKEIGVNTDQFDKCVDTQQTKPKIQAHWKLATDRKLPGTPTFLIGDQQISEFLSYDDLKKIVEEQIAKGATTPVPGGATFGPSGDSGKGTALAKPHA